MTMSPLLLMLLLLPMMRATRLEQGACYVESVPGTVFTSLGVQPIDSMDVESCRLSCRQLLMHVAGITSGHICLCALNPGQLQLTDGAECGLVCEDGKECGGFHGHFSVYEAFDNENNDTINIDFDVHLDTIERSVRLKSVDVSFSDADLRALVYVDDSDGGPSYTLTDEAVGVEEISSTLTNLVWNLDAFPPGQHFIQVIVKDASSELSAFSVASFEVEGASEILGLNCPRVASESFKCHFEAFENERGELSTQMGDQKANTFLPLKSQDVFVGHPVPRQSLSENVQYLNDVVPQTSVKALKPTILYTARPIDQVVKVRRVEWQGHVEDNDIQLHVYAYTGCPEGSTLQRLTGLCESRLFYASEMDTDTKMVSHTCTANANDLFNAVFGICLPNTCATQSQLCAQQPERASEFEEVGSPLLLTSEVVGSKYKFVTLDPEEQLTLQPGQLLAVSGARIDYRSSSVDGPSDISASSFVSVSKVHVVRATLSVPIIQTLESKCESSEVTVNFFNDKSNVESRVSCEVRIEELKVETSTEMTEQTRSDFVLAEVKELVFLNVTTTKGNPINYQVSWGDDSELETLFTEEDERWVVFSHVYGSDSDFRVTVRAWNTHSEEDEIEHEFIFYVRVQVAVKDWQLTAPVLWLRDTGPYPFGWTLSSMGSPLPTMPTMTCMWGDSNAKTPNKAAFDLSRPAITSNYTFIIGHKYEQHGLYEIQCTMANDISQQTLALNVTVLEKIREFRPQVAVVDFEPLVSRLLQSETKVIRAPVPSQLLITWQMDAGTVEVMSVLDSSSASQPLSSLALSDPFSPTTSNHTITLTKSDLYTFQLNPMNTLDSDSMSVIEIEALLVPEGLSVDDLGQVTQENENKFVFIDFEQLGNHTCLSIDFGDGVTMTIGDEEFCSLWKPEIDFDPDVPMIMPITVSHVYHMMGVFEMRLEAANPVSSVPLTTSLSLLVGNGKCNVPFVSIVEASENPKEPTVALLFYELVLQTRIGTNCSGVINTKKHWSVEWVSVAEGKGSLASRTTVLKSYDLDQVSVGESDTSVLKIKGRALDIGLMRVSFKARIWDDDDSDPHQTRVLPFEKSATTFVLINASPLKAGLVAGVERMITRGVLQTLVLEPYLYSLDPDRPEDKDEGMEIRLFCKREDEAWPLTDDNEHVWEQTAIIPEERLNDTTQGGCFGTGIGGLNNTDGFVIIPGSLFVETNVIYDFRTEVYKDVRMAAAELRVLVIDGMPPIISISCMDSSLCVLDDRNRILINPSIRLPLVSECSFTDNSDCTPPMTYQWSLDESESSITEAFVGPSNSSQLVISTDYMLSRSGMLLTLEAVNGKDSMGMSQLEFVMNNPPENGTCIVEPRKGTTLVDTFKLFCQDWTDPEHHSVDKFTIFATDLTGSVTTLGTVEHLSPTSPQQLLLPPGIHRVSVEVFDSLGASNLFEMQYEVVVEQPSLDQAGELMDKDLILEMIQNGDSAAAIMALQARTQVMDALEREGELIEKPLLLYELMPNEVPLDEEEKDRRLSVQLGEAKLESIELLLEALKTTDINDMDTINMLAEAVKGIVGEAAAEGSSSNVGVELIQLVTEAMEKLVANLKGSGSNDPDGLVDTVENVIDVFGRLLEETMNTAGIDTENGDVCSHLKPIDLERANQPDSAFEYETYIDDIDMTVPSDPEVAMCNGIVDNARSLGAETGEKLVKMTAEMALEMLSTLVVDEERIIERGPITVYTKMVSGPELKEWRVVGFDPSTDVRIRFADTWCLGPIIDGECKTPAGIAAVSYAINPLCNVPTCDRLAPDTKVVDIHVTTQDAILVDVSHVLDRDGHQGIHMDIPRTNSSESILPIPHFYNATREGNVHTVPYMSHQVIVDKADSGISLEFYPEKVDADYLLLLDFERIPTRLKYDLAITTRNLKHTWNGDLEFFDWYISDFLVMNRTGRWFVTIMALDSEHPQFDSLITLLDNYGAGREFNLSRVPFPAELFKDFQSNYRLRSYSSGCYFYEPLQRAWIANGLMIDDPDHESTYCRSHHLTAFATGFFVVANTIDFEFIFTEADFEDNITIYVALIVTSTLFVLTLIWAIWQDVRDERRLITRPLVDNRVDDHYMYEILTFTGPWKTASCDSKVFFVLTGSEDETEVRVLDPGACVHDDNPKWKGTLRKGCVDSYLVKVPRPLGELSFMRIWHDNTGRGNYSGWFLTAVVVRDVQTNETFEFILNRWLACEKDDGQVDRLIPCTGLEQRRELKHAFLFAAEKNLREHHTFFSIFMRNERSRFTRVQRTLVAFVFLSLAMVGNALVYHLREERFEEQGLRVGPLFLNIYDLSVGVIVNAMAILPTLVLSALFRKSGRMARRENRINQALDEHERIREERLQEQRLQEQGLKEEGLVIDDDDLVDHDEDATEKAENVAGTHGVERNVLAPEAAMNRCQLPFVFNLLAWLLCVLLLALSFYMLLVIGVTFGNDKTFKWLSSNLFGFFICVLVLEPLKVVLISMCMALVMKNVKLDDDDVVCDETPALITSSVHWYSASRRTRSDLLHPIDEEFLAQVRLERIKEVEMWKVVHEIARYIVFIIILFVISYFQRDIHSFRLKQQLERSFIRNHDFHHIATSNDWWHWAHSAIVDELRAQAHYNGQPPYGLRGYIGDKTQRIVGYAILRQVRVRPNTCRVDHRVQNMTQECARASNLIFEDQQHYCDAWFEMNELTRHLPSCHGPEFKYTTAEELEALPYTALLDVYGGGGYVYRINSKAKKVREDLVELQQQHWVNNHTRGLFLDFAIYNPNVNMFAIGSIVAEFLPGGGIVPFWRFDPVKLLVHHGPMGNVLILCQIVFVLYIISFTWGQLVEIQKRKADYWTSYWTLAEWTVIGLSYVAIVLFALRMILTTEILNTFVESKGNGYIRMQYVGLVDTLLGHSIALILFVGNIKFIKLLRFNNRFNMLILTLRGCWDDLSGFIAIFFFIFFAFVQVFYMSLHTDMMQFHTIIASFETCFTMLLNRFKFGGIRESSMTAAVMFFIFAISCSFILINVMLTIIIEAFETVKRELAERGNQYEIMQFLQKQSRTFIGLDPLPPRVSVLSNDVEDRRRRQSLKDPGVAELPDKVDAFVNFVNDTYFDGQLDVQTKRNLANQTTDEDNNADYRQEPVRRRVFASD